MSDLQVIPFTQGKKKREKRKMNGFMIFRKEMLENSRKDNVTMTEHSKRAAEQWKNMSETQQNKYKRKYEMRRDSEFTLIREKIIDLINQLSQLLVSSNEMIYSYDIVANISNLKSMIMNEIEEYINKVYQYEEKTPGLLLKVFKELYSLSIGNNLIPFDDFFKWYIELYNINQ
jgi:hypothetical protein